MPLMHWHGAILNFNALISRQFQNVMLIQQRQVGANEKKSKE